MSGYPVDKPVSKDNNYPVDRHNDLHQDRPQKTYQSKDRYLRHKQRSKPQLRPADEPMDPQSFKAFSYEKMPHAQANFPTTARYITRQDESATVTPQLTIFRVIPSRSQQAGTSAASLEAPQQHKREIDPEALAFLEGYKRHPSPKFDEERVRIEGTQAYFRNLDSSPSKTTAEVVCNKSPHLGKGKEPQSDEQPKRQGGNPNRHYYVHKDSPVVSSKLSSEFALTRRLESPSPFLNEGQASGYTPTGSDVQAGSHFDAGSSAQPSKHPRFGQNRFANLQEADYERSQYSPASSHHTVQSGYKPAYLRYAQAEEPCDDPAPMTPPRPLQLGQRFEAAGPRDYSALMNRPQRPYNDGHGFEAFPGMQSAGFEYHQERSQSARGFYSPHLYSARPLPPLPPNARLARQQTAESPTPLQRVEGNRERFFREGARVAPKSSSRQLRKAKSSVYDSRATAASYQQRVSTPEFSHPRKPPPVPPAAPRLRTSDDYLARIGSGIDCLAGMSEQAAATSAVALEFLDKIGVEGFVKSLYRSHVQDMLTKLRNLDGRIDWLGDSLWKGSSDARRLFLDQNNGKITVVYNRVSRVICVCMLIYTNLIPDAWKVDQLEL